MPNSSFKDNSSVSSEESDESDGSQDPEDVEREILITRSIKTSMREF